jgi:hypothetical protein
VLHHSPRPAAATATVAFSTGKINEPSTRAPAPWQRRSTSARKDAPSILKALVDRGRIKLA